MYLRRLLLGATVEANDSLHAETPLKGTEKVSRKVRSLRWCCRVEAFG